MTHFFMQSIGGVERVFGYRGNFFLNRTFNNVNHQIFIFRIKIAKNKNALPCEV